MTITLLIDHLVKLKESEKKKKKKEREWEMST